jgi:hypothetical protein
MVRTNSRRPLAIENKGKLQDRVSNLPDLDELTA